MNADQRRERALRDLRTEANRLESEIDKLNRKKRWTEGLNARQEVEQAAYIQPYITRLEVQLTDVEKLIKELEAVPHQYPLF